MNRVHQGSSGMVVPVKLVDAFACYHKRGYRGLPIADRTVSEGYTQKIATAGEQERS